MSKWEGLAFIGFCVSVATAVCYCYTHQTKYDCTESEDLVIFYAKKCEGVIYSSYRQCFDEARELYCEAK